MSSDTATRSAVRWLLAILLFCVGLFGIPAGGVGSAMNERQADKAVNNFLLLVGVTSLIASIGLGRRSTWSRAAGGVVATSVALFVVVLAVASRDQNTIASAILMGIFFVAVGAAVYLAVHYATGEHEVRSPAPEP